MRVELNGKELAEFKGDKTLTGAWVGSGIARNHSNMALWQQACWVAGLAGRTVDHWEQVLYLVCFICGGVQ